MWFLVIFKKSYLKPTKLISTMQLQFWTEKENKLVTIESVFFTSTINCGQNLVNNCVLLN